MKELAALGWGPHSAQTRQQELTAGKYKYTLNKTSERANQPANVPFNLLNSLRRGKLWSREVVTPLTLALGRGKRRGTSWRNGHLICTVARGEKAKGRQKIQTLA